MICSCITFLYDSLHMILLSISNSDKALAPCRSLTYDLSIRAQDGGVLSHWGTGGHQSNSFPDCLGFDLRHNDVSAREILRLTPALPCE